ncbi:MAG: hypothetical protein LHW49_05200 [Candidatus Cloacimonetes bacterium]|nr:hypothetical protein [Candidatus Cloacimonadota bacterium]MDD2649678.1 hypothetical protein [Candidatus Cloacimonadota bacterium]MDD3502056.1 hypothetical protein [Candidatus Cloacimonadota bacterium]
MNLTVDTAFDLVDKIVNKNYKSWLRKEDLKVFIEKQDWEKDYKELLLSELE